MKQIFTLSVLLACLLLTDTLCYSQNFLWGTRGGSSEATQGGIDDETIVDIATDKNDNIYILYQAKKQGLNAAGTPLVGYGSRDIILASFKANGNLRWAKVIGSGKGDIPFGLGVDAKDGVYACGAVVKLNDGPANIDTDAVSPKNYQHFIIVKYDTAGKYQWHRHPEADTITSAVPSSKTQSVAMDVDDAGNTYWVMRLYPGVYGGSLQVSTMSTCVLKYSATGNFSYFKPMLDVDLEGALGMNMAVDITNGRFYISGEKSGGIITMGGNPVTGSMYIGCFKMDGSLMWKKENTTGGGKFFSRAVIDGSGNIYLAGCARAQTGTTPPTPATNFNGYIVSNGGGHNSPFVVKMDKDGNNIWARDAKVNAATIATSIALRNNSEVVISGNYPGLLEWPGYQYPGFNSPPNYGYDLFITRFDANNGWVLGMDKIASNSGTDEKPTRMASDGKGNVYIGGEFKTVMYATPLDTLKSTGGDSDWFLVKYGDMWPASVAEVEGNDVKVYPNPAADHLVIEGINTNTQLTISNMLGQQVHNKVLNGEREFIDISNLQVGNYILQLTDEKGNRTNRKITKQ